MSTESMQEIHHGQESSASDVLTQEMRDNQDPALQELRVKLPYLLWSSDGPEAAALCASLGRRFPGQFQELQVHAVQAEVNAWRAVTASSDQVLSDQAHGPGGLGASDFYSMDGLRIKVAGRLFRHKLYHFILPYSHWESGMVCFADSFEALSHGLQNALWELGGVPEKHCTDRRTAAVNASDDRTTFRRRYRALLDNYGVQPLWFNGRYWYGSQVAMKREQCFKQALAATLMLRGSRDFSDPAEYERFVRDFFNKRNGGRAEAVAAERSALRALPAERADAQPRCRVRVTKGSTIRVLTNTYSVPSELIGAIVDVLITTDTLELRLENTLVETLRRVRGQHKCRIDFRHVIGWLLHEPKAFAQFRYRDSLFPTRRFRQAYDMLVAHFPPRANETYLRILSLAANWDKAVVDVALGRILDWGAPITPAVVEDQVWHELRIQRAMRPVPPMKLPADDAIRPQIQE